MEPEKPKPAVFPWDDSSSKDLPPLPDESCKGCAKMKITIDAMRKLLTERKLENCQVKNQQILEQELDRSRKLRQEGVEREFALIQRNTALLHEKNELIEKMEKEKSVMAKENDNRIKQITALLEQERTMKRLFQMENAMIKAQEEASKKESIECKETKD